MMPPVMMDEAKEPQNVEKRPIQDEDGSDRDAGATDMHIDRAKEIKLLAKLDLAFIPVIMLVYLSCFLDRSNIGLLFCSPSWLG